MTRYRAEQGELRFGFFSSCRAHLFAKVQDLTVERAGNERKISLPRENEKDLLQLVCRSSFMTETCINNARAKLKV